MKIYSTVKDFNGLRNNVRFVNGVGETDNPQVIEWFRSHGYSVEKCDKVSENSVEKCDKYNEYESQTVVLDGIQFHGLSPENLELTFENAESKQPDFNAMTPNELRDWMRENGYGSKIKNTRNKEKLLEILRG